MFSSFWFYWLAFFGIILSRYFLVAGGAYLLFYSGLGKLFITQTLRLQPPRWKAMRRDMELSVLSAVIFALGSAIVMVSYDGGTTLLYADHNQYGLWYLGVSFIAVLLLQDMYFYFIHRLLHHPRLFRWFHRGHHRSGDPTPWTSFAFDLPEAIVQVLFMVGIVFTIPLHFVTLIALLLTMTLWTVWNHLGIELFPPQFARHWFSRWFIGATHHSIHHRRYTVHYGLYFTLWDNLLGTHDPEYETHFAATLKRRAEA